MMQSELKAILRQIAKDWFIGTPFKIGRHLEGQGLTARKCFLLGTRLPFEEDPDMLLHEMGHLVEREEEKLLKRPTTGWGFRHGRYWSILGRACVGAPGKS